MGQRFMEYLYYGQEKQDSPSTEQIRQVSSCVFLAGDIICDVAFSIFEVVI